MADPMTLREKVARAIYDAIAPWEMEGPDGMPVQLSYDDQHVLLKKQYVKKADAAIRLVLEEAAKVACPNFSYEYRNPQTGESEPGSPYDHGRFDAAKAIRSLGDKT